MSFISDLRSFLLQPHHSFDYKRLWLPVLWFGLYLYTEILAVAVVCVGESGPSVVFEQ